MEIQEVGQRLRNRRVVAGRTIASVAADAGLSVPYIANLENGRGNPTLSALNNLVSALGARLVVELADDEATVPHTPALPEELVQFSRSSRFSGEAARLAEAGSGSATAARDRLLRAMAGVASLSGRPLSELDCHRILDAIVLISRPPGA